jgi:hypothetical protein
MTDSCSQTRFTDARRPALKAEQPELSFADMSKVRPPPAVLTRWQPS